MDNATQAAAESFRVQITSWYDEYKRTLPWRGLLEFYPVWVSEIMCQQTQVATVIPYFERWLEALPDIQSLAECDEESVLKLWEGLGYNRRARFLHKGARYVLENGEPQNYDELLAVPGIGPYTAGAIASIVFSEKVPAVDGNVLRVVSRVRAIFDPVDTKAGISTVRDFASMALLNENKPGDFNQAIMELGALVCRPKAPKCSTCPLNEDCVAYLEFIPTDLPIKSKKIKVAKWSPFATIYRKGARIGLKQERDKELLAGLWGVPLTAAKPPEAREIAEVRHKFTHRDTYYNVCVSEEAMDLEYFLESELDQIPISTGMKKVIAAFFSWQVAMNESL